MKHPAYHLRPNKAVERLLFVEAIGRIQRFDKLSEYTYYGFGGPYLDDFRLIYESFPEISLVSIEEDLQTYKRQEFHLPCGTLKLKQAQFKSFLTQYVPDDEKSIFWLDYTNLSYSNFQDFMMLLDKITENSMIKISLRAEPSDFIDKPNEKRGTGAEKFRRQFGAIMPDQSITPPFRNMEFACLLQDMIQIAAQKTLPSALPLMFQPVSSFFYSDGTCMFTLNGIVCSRGAQQKIKDAFQSLHFTNTTWAKPKSINLPVLSTKERLHLQKHLPCYSNVGKTLREVLGYSIDVNRGITESRLKQYADFHRYYPYFMKAVP